MGAVNLGRRPENETPTFSDESDARGDLKPGKGKEQVYRLPRPRDKQRRTQSRFILPKIVSNAGHLNAHHPLNQRSRHSFTWSPSIVS